MCEDLNSLASIVGVGKEDLKKYFTPDTTKSYLYHLCSSLQNSGMMHNTIQFTGKNFSVIEEVMQEFHVDIASRKYTQWGDIYRAFLSKGILDRGSREKKETNWEKYSKGLYEGLQFLVNGGETLIKKLSSSKDLTADSIKKVKEISKKIHGLGFALTCDWLKECGCTWLAKPDVHINEVIKALLNRKSISDEEILTEIYSWAKEIELSGVDPSITAYKLDRTVWLLCTEDFFLDHKSSGRESLIRKIKSNI